MIGRAWQVLAAGLLVLTAGLWAVAATAPWWSRATYEPNGLSIAVAQQDGWLVMVQVSRAGMVRVRRFDKNLTHDQWFTMRARPGPRFSIGPQPTSVFTAKQTTEARSTSIWFHIMPMLVIAMVMSLHAFGWPWWRRQRRLKRGLCLRCAYDMRQATSPVCPECGHQNRRVSIKSKTNRAAT